MTSTDLIREFDGADISHHQYDAGPVNLWETRKTPSDWFAAKATQSTRYLDPSFEESREVSAALGFRQRPWYHWLSSMTNPITQADHYMNQVFPLIPGEGVMLDAEEAGIDVDRSAVWMEEVEDETHRPCSFYSGLYVAGGTLWKSQRIRMSAYGPRPMHLAAYVSVASLLARLKSTGTLGLPIHAWQYSSNGPVPGITGRCDMNSIIDVKSYDLSCGVIHTIPPIPVPPIQEDDMLPIVTNAEQFFDVPAQEMKWALMDDGRLRHLDPTEWMTRGGLAGTPWMNGDIGAHGIWSPTPAPTATIFTGTVSGTVG